MTGEVAALREEIDRLTANYNLQDKVGLCYILCTTIYHSCTALVHHSYGSSICLAVCWLVGWQEEHLVRKNLSDEVLAWLSVFFISFYFMSIITKSMLFYEFQFVQEGYEALGLIHTSACYKVL